MKNMYERFAISSIETGLLRNGFQLNREVSLGRNQFDLLVTKAEGKGKISTFAVDFKLTGRRSVTAADFNKAAIGGTSVVVHRAYIDPDAKVVRVDGTLGKALRGVTIGDLEVVVFDATRVNQKLATVTRVDRSAVLRRPTARKVAKKIVATNAAPKKGVAAKSPTKKAGSRKVTAKKIAAKKSAGRKLPSKTVRKH